MRNLGFSAVGFGLICFLASIALALTADARLPVPLAITGARLFVGGAILGSKR